MAIYPITVEPFGVRPDLHDAFVKIVLWERDKRAPVHVEVRISKGELEYMLREIDRVREDHTQDKMF